MVQRPTADPLVSYRDPGGRVIVQDGRVCREVNTTGRQNWEEFHQSAAISQFIRQGSSVSAEILSDSPEKLVLEHPLIAPATYPLEWTAGMLYAAAELTLDIADALVEEGRGLKDATPYNILFNGPQPVFIDVLSIEARNPLDPIWRPLSEFQRTFLLPLAAWRDLGIAPTHSIGWHRDGIDIEAAVRWAGPIRKGLAPWRSIATVPTRLNKMAEKKGTTLYHARDVSSPEASKFVLKRLFARLRNQLRSLRPRSASSKWANYRDENTYSDSERSSKHGFVLEKLRNSKRVLDLGANTGEYSFLAASHGCRTVAVEGDAVAADSLWRGALESNLPISVVVADISSPTAGGGWCGKEYPGLLSRLGWFDSTLMLALIHHLSIQARVPMDHIAVFAATTSDHVIVEWVGADDPQVLRIQRGRDLPPEIQSQTTFEMCFERYFHIEDRSQLKPSRCLYSLRRKREC